MEWGSYLIDPTCGKAVWFTTPDANANAAARTVQSAYRKVPDANFQLVKDKEYAKFTKFTYGMVTEFQPEYQVTATFTGRIDHCKEFKLDKKGFGNGFGVMGKSEFQLVLRSVSDVRAEDTPGRSAIPDHIPEN